MGGAEVTKVCGIPCSLKTAEARQALETVLARIQERHPKDLERLVGAVESVEPITGADDGTQGQWVARKPTEAYGHPSLEWGYTVPAPGVLYVREDDKHLVAVIAHELGHACSVKEDLQRRGQLLKDGWASELAADWYAYRWGFGREIARLRPHRDRKHHLVGPGQEYEEDRGGTTYRFRVSRNFEVTLISKE